MCAIYVIAYKSARVQWGVINPVLHVVGLTQLDELKSLKAAGRKDL